MKFPLRRLYFPERESVGSFGVIMREEPSAHVLSLSLSFPSVYPSRLIGNIFGAHGTQKCCLREDALERTDGQREKKRGGSL